MLSQPLQRSVHKMSLAKYDHKFKIEYRGDEWDIFNSIRLFRVTNNVDKNILIRSLPSKQCTTYNRITYTERWLIVKKSIKLFARKGHMSKNTHGTRHTACENKNTKKISQIYRSTTRWFSTGSKRTCMRACIFVHQMDFFSSVFQRSEEL